MRRELLLAAALLVGGAASAQMFGDWSEGPVPDAPPLRTDALIPVEMPGSDLSFGVDATSVSVGKDGVVRYVLVATSRAGAVNAFYEGVHCPRATYRVYARYSSPQGWRPVDTGWKELLNEGLEGRHAWRVARAGVCAGRTAGGNRDQIVHALKTRPDIKSGF